MIDRAVIGAWVGSSNLGDELIFSILLRLLEERGVEAIVPSVDPSKTKANFDVNSFSHLNFPKLKNQMTNSDALIFGGGGLLQDETGMWNLPFHLSRISAARKQNLPWIGVALGASGLTSKRALKQVSSKFKDHLGVSVRDENSAQILESLDIPNVVRAADLGWLWDVNENIRSASSSSFLGVSLRNPQTARFLPAAVGPKASSSEETMDALAASIDAVAISTGLKIRFISLNTDEDALLHHRVADRLKVNSEILNPDLNTFEQCFHNVEAVVTMRYHSGLMGALKGAAVVCLPFSRKLDSLVPVLGSAASKSTPHDLASVVEKVLAGRSELTERVEELRTHSYKNIQVIELLDGIK
ncbi:MAG: hypothetical protein CMB18_00120 [Euryarchaeota archaeon]|nr:hypothetical protein [Euryarchaeota archaeon]